MSQMRPTEAEVREAARLVVDYLIDDERREADALGEETEILFALRVLEAFARAEDETII